MLKVYETLKDKDDIALLLQVHDELIFEVEESSVEKYSEILADIMKNTVKLEDVNLNININIGKNWAEAKQGGRLVSYSSNVKQEITQKIPVTNLECLAEISSIFENKANLVKEGIEIKMENSILAKRLYSLIKATSSLQFGIKYSITKKFTEHRIYVITLYKQKGLKEFLESI